MLWFRLCNFCRMSGFVVCLFLVVELGLMVIINFFGCVVMGFF